MKKKIVSIGLATTLLMGTVAFANNDKAVISEAPDKEVISEGLEIEEGIMDTQENKSNYIGHKGKITEVNREDGLISIVVDVKGTLADNEISTPSAVKFNISEDTLVLSDKTQDLVKADKLVEGALVEVSYSKDSPMTRSLPPMTNADVVVLKEATDEKAQLGIKVDRFKDQTSVDNFLKYNITEDTVMVDSKGNKVSEKDLEDKDLIVFYGPATTMSIPAQSNAVKIIVLDEKKEVETPEKPEVPEMPEENTEIKVLDKISYYKDEQLSAEASLKNKIYKSEDTFMIPVREIAETLGYKVSWNSVARQAELTKGANFITINKDKDMYSFAKMTVKLDKAPEIKEGTMFVPLNFIEEVMQLEMEITQDGMINIK